LWERLPGRDRRSVFPEPGTWLLPMISLAGIGYIAGYGPQPHSHRLRTGRRSEPGACYLLTTCCDGRTPRLSGARAADIILDTLCWLDGEGAWNCLRPW
jgi:hypothetical protein